MKQTQPNTTANKHGMLYDLEDKVPAVQSVIYGIQYLVYFLAGSAIMPVIIGAYLGLDQAEIAQMLQRTFLLSVAFPFCRQSSDTVILLLMDQPVSGWDF